MPTPSYTTTCTENTKIARDIFELRFTKPEGLKFLPGQYLLWDVPLLEDGSDIQTRAFSIASSPEEKDMLFVVKILEGGRASMWVESGLKVGDTVRMQGPFGRFLLDRNSGKDWLLVATSTGIAPYRSQLVSFLKDETRRIDLLLGVRSEEDLFWTEEFTAMARKYSHFFFHPALTKPSADWKGHTGRVQTLFEKIVQDFARVQVYACGNPEMTKDVKKICMERFGMTKGDVHVEGYI